MGGKRSKQAPYTPGEQADLERFMPWRYVDKTLHLLWDEAIARPDYEQNIRRWQALDRGIRKLARMAMQTDEDEG